MKISLIVAMSANRVIGVNNSLPWHLSADLKRFRTLTTGKAIVMGRKTHESIGRALPDRTNIILTRDTTYHAPDCIVVHNTAQALAAASPAEELMVIGGASVYAAFFPLAQRLYVTAIDATFAGDTQFPAWDAASWLEVQRETVRDDASVPFTYSFIVLERRPIA